MEFKSLKNIETSFRQIRLFTLVFLGLCAVVLATDGAVRTWLIVVAALAAVAIGIYIERTLRGHKYHPPVDPNLDGVEESHGLHHHKEKHNDEA